MNLRYPILLLVSAVLPLAATAQTSYLNVDFGTYTRGAAAVGQDGWNHLNVSGDNPLFVGASGALILPDNAVIDGQDMMKAFSSVIPAPLEGTTTLHLDARIVVTSAGANPSYFMALQGGTFANARFVAKAEGTGYVLGVRVTGQSGYPYAYGDTEFSFDTTVFLKAVIHMVAGNQNDLIELYAGTDPTRLTLQATSRYVSGSANDPTDYNALIISQFGSETVHQSGMEIYSLSVTEPAPSSVDGLRETVDGFKLDPAYPNPFNPSTVIGYQLSEVGQTRVAVYDLLGREVAVLVDGVMPAGDHTATFDAAGLPSGIYLVRLESAGRMATQRVTLLK